MEGRLLVEAKYPTPVFSGKDFPALMPKDKVITDELGLFRPLEMIAFKGTSFVVVKSYKVEHYPEVLEIFYPKYSQKQTYFIDARFVRPQREKIKLTKLQERENIIENLGSLVGKKYVWGGNFPLGISQMESWYPLIDKSNLYKRTFEGVDCSGMLYYVTQGLSPRNTRELMTFGTPIQIENLSMKEIKRKLRPLDLVVWKGHIFFVLDSDRSIESRVYKGCVYTTSLLERLETIYEEDRKIPRDNPDEEDGFVIRRWL